MSPQRPAGILVWVFLAFLAIFFLIAGLGIPPGGNRTKGEQTQTLQNLRYLYIATQTMSLDAEASGRKDIGWPGDTIASAREWAEQLLRNDYMRTNDLCKLLSAGDRVVTPENLFRPEEWAVRVYTVKRSSDSNAIFLTSANFTNTPTGGEPLDSKAQPYGDKGFVVFRKNGAGSIYRAAQVGQTNLIGSYVPLCR